MTRRLLVVDDEPQMVKTFVDILRFHNWDADGAYSGEEALAKLEGNPYDAVLMDVRMPGLNGVETFTRMKRLRPGIRVILMTAYTAQELLEQAKKEGVLAVIPKPVNVQGLMKTLDEVRKGRGPVLVVDDDPSFLQTLAAVLRGRGYEVFESSALDQAVALLETTAPRVVLLDLRLDSRAPRDSVLAIREVNPLVTIVLYSGHAALLDDTVGGLPERWIHAALHKPFPPAELLKVLDDVVSG